MWVTSGQREVRSSARIRFSAYSILVPDIIHRPCNNASVPRKAPSIPELGLVFGGLLWNWWVNGRYAGAAQPHHCHTKVEPSNHQSSRLSLVLDKCLFYNISG